MRLNIFLIMIIFQFYSTYDIIPITNFEKKFVNLTPTNDFIIFSYYIPGRSNLTNYYHLITYYDFSHYYDKMYFYLYDNKSKIKQNDEGNFINYIIEDYLVYYSDQVSIEESFRYNKTYYFALKQSVKLETDRIFTLSVYSTETFANIDNFIQAKMNVYKYNIYNYKFHIPLEHKKYVLFECRTGMIANITIVDNNEKIVYEKKDILGKDYLELKDENSYNIYLNFCEDKKYSSGFIYFYFIQSKYTKFFPVVKDTEYFQHLYANEKFKLLLDLSSIKKGNLIWVEYIQEWNSKDYSLDLYGYDTEDEDIIEKTKGKLLSLNRKGSCYGNICKGSILKDSDDIKLVILEVDNDYRFDALYFDIKYGKVERYIPQTVLYSFIIGLSLSIPNLVFQAILCYRDEKLKCHYKCTLFMDFILHIPHGCVLSVLFYLAGKTSLTVSYWFYGAYAVLFIVNTLLIIYNNPSIFTGINNLLKKVGNFRTFKEALNERKKSPPQIIVDKNYNFYYGNKENYFEYEYCSWEDNTDFILNENNPVLECKFQFEILLDDETYEDLQTFKANLENEEKSTFSKYYTHFLVPNCTVYETCILEPANRKDKFFVFLWFIVLITGYLDILEPFIYFEVAKVDISISKLISNKKKYSCSYKLNNNNTDGYYTSNKNEIYESKELIENEDTKRVESMTKTNLKY